MNIDLQAKINKAIAESIPAEVGEALRQRLQQANELEETCFKQVTALQRRETELKAAHQGNEEMTQRLRAHGELGKREDAVKEREIKQQIIELEFKLKAEERVSAALDSALKGLVRNTEFRRVLQGSDGSYDSSTGRNSNVSTNRDEKYSAE